MTDRRFAVRHRGYVLVVLFACPIAYLLFACWRFTRRLSEMAPHDYLEHLPEILAPVLAAGLLVMGTFQAVLAVSAANLGGRGRTFFRWLAVAMLLVVVVLLYSAVPSFRADVVLFSASIVIVALADATIASQYEGDGEIEAHVTGVWRDKGEFEFLLSGVNAPAFCRALSLLVTGRHGSPLSLTHETDLCVVYRCGPRGEAILVREAGSSQDWRCVVRGRWEQETWRGIEALRVTLGGPRTR